LGLFAVLSVLQCGAGAQQSGQISLTLPTGNGTITVTADEAAGDFNVKGATLKGNVVVHDGANTLGAPLIRLHFTDSKVDRAETQGKTVIDTPSGAAVANSGVYELSTRVVTLEGNVVLTQGENVIRGDKLFYNTVTGIARIEAQPGRRIKALLHPKTGQ
jgi:lipopolysaccharide transport protein LptA